MVKYANGKIYISDYLIGEVSGECLRELQNVIQDIDVEDIPTLNMQDSNGTDAMKLFEKAWRKDKKLRPGKRLLEKEGRKLIVDDCGGNSLYVSRLPMPNNLELYQFQVLGKKSHVENVMLCWSDIVKSLYT